MYVGVEEGWVEVHVPVGYKELGLFWRRRRLVGEDEFVVDARTCGTRASTFIASLEVTQMMFTLLPQGVNISHWKTRGKGI